MKTNKQNTAKYHQEKIARKTLSMTPVMADIMGGISVEQSEIFLLSIGYSYKEINKLKGV